MSMGRPLQVRDLPDDIHAALRARAEAAGFSLSEYVTRALAEVAARPAISDTLKWAGERSGGATTEQIVDAVRAGRDGR